MPWNIIYDISLSLYICYIISYYVISYYTIVILHLYYIYIMFILYYIILYYIILYYIILYYVYIMFILYYILLYYIILYYIILYNIILYTHIERCTCRWNNQSCRLFSLFSGDPPFVCSSNPQSGWSDDQLSERSPLQNFTWLHKILIHSITSSIKLAIFLPSNPTISLTLPS